MRHHQGCSVLLIASVRHNTSPINLIIGRYVWVERVAEVVLGMDPILLCRRIHQLKGMVSFFTNQRKQNHTNLGKGRVILPGGQLGVDGLLHLGETRASHVSRRRVDFGIEENHC